MNWKDLDPSIEDAWAGRELKLCRDTTECCKELSRVWLALGDSAMKRPYLGSASERVRELRRMRESQDQSSFRAEKHVGSTELEDALGRLLDALYSQWPDTYAVEGTEDFRQVVKHAEETLRLYRIALADGDPRPLGDDAA